MKTTEAEARYAAARPALERVLAGKAAMRKKLARLPIHEKVKIVIQMQKAAAPLLRAQGKRAVVWGLKAAEITADKAE